MSKTVAVMKANKTVAPVLSVPPALAACITPFSNFVAAQVAASEKATPLVVSAIVPVVAKMPLRVQNGRKEYSRGTSGRLLFETADKLQATNPNVPLTSAVMRVALPQIPAASISAGMTHWRQFNGTVKSKNAA